MNEGFSTKSDRRYHGFFIIHITEYGIAERVREESRY